MRKFLSASVVALSLAGLAGAAAAADLEVSPYGKEGQERGLHFAGPPAFQTVSPASRGEPSFVNREASEGLQAEATEAPGHTLRQTAGYDRPWAQFDQEAAYRGR